MLAALRSDQPRDDDELAGLTGLPVRTVASALAALELDGLAILLPGRTYVRSTPAAPEGAGA